MPDESRIPVLVGVGQLRANRDRTVDGAREPLDLMTDALGLAERDANSAGLLRDADSLVAIRTASWAYDDLAGAVAARIGAVPRTCENTRVGGHLPARLLDRAAGAIWAGESDVAVIVGGEAQASVNTLAKAGIDPVDVGWSATPGAAPALDLSEFGSAEMLAAGLVLPPRTYPLFENRLQADLGLTPEENAGWSARLYAELSRVAAQHPVAWNRDELTPEQVGTVGPGNRMICEPYPLSMNAMPNVDQAVAVVVTSLQAARERGIPADRLTYVWGGAGVDDPPDPLRRTGFSGSEALGQALDRSLDAAGVPIGEVDLVDVYSCFPIVPKLAALHLGLGWDAVLSVAGGHSSFGGPLNTYSLHAIATMAERLRAGAASGLVHANGGFLSYQHSVLLGARPHRDGYIGRPEPVAVAHPDAPTVLDAATAAQDGPDLVVETATVEHGRDGAPQQAFVVGRTPAGHRVAAATAPGDRAGAAGLSLAHLPPGAITHVGRTVRLSFSDGEPAVTVPAGASA